MSKVVIAKVIFVFFGILFFSCSRSNSKGDIKFQQYYAQGELIYGQRCSNCHQKSGQGLGLLYPPLEKSDYLDRNFEDVICLIKYGTKGEIIVNGKAFNKSMPGVPTLTELEITELATFLYNTWGRDRGLVEVQRVNRIIEKCKQ